MAEEVKQLGEDHEVWLKCFVATLPGQQRHSAQRIPSDRNT
jgi:hypothetical protein